MGKKASIAVAATGFTGLGIGVILLASKSGASQTELPTDEEQVTEQVVTQSTEGSEDSTQQTSSEQSASSSTPAAPAAPKPSNKGISGDQHKEVNFFKSYWQQDSSNRSWNKWYFGSDSAISNVEDFELKDSEEISSSNREKTTKFLSKYDIGDHNQTKSSLRITSRKLKYKDDKWKGSVSWFWSFAHENRGFITYNVAESSPTEKKLLLSGGFYLMEMDKSTKKWTIKYHKEISKDENKTIDLLNFHKYFPKPYWWTKNGGFDKVYYENWHFITGIQEMNEMCGPGECTDTPRAQNTVGAWEWRGGDWYDENCDTFILKDWCDKVWAWSGDWWDNSDLQWWTHMYGNVDFNLKKYLSSFYRGAWYRKYTL